MAKTCPICGNTAFMYYPLCKSCLDLSKQGDIVKCEQCGTWHKKNENCKCDNKENSITATIDKNCLICDTPFEVVCPEYAKTQELHFCKECFKDIKERRDDFDKNESLRSFTDYYFNLRSNIYRIQNFAYVKENCKKLVTLANLTYDIHRSTALNERVIDDIKDIIEKKKPKNNNKQNITKQSEETDSRKGSLLPTLDNHLVKSQGERIIDNILYNNRICHCYEKQVTDITYNERTVLSDFFIPVISNSKGIYIEFWGKKTTEYNLNKEEKRKLYKEHNIPLIEVEKDDVLDEAQLEIRIMREINTWKNQIKNTI